MRFILFFADVLLTNMRCDKLINKTFYNMFHSRLVFVSPQCLDVLFLVFLGEEGKVSLLSVHDPFLRN